MARFTDVFIKKPVMASVISILIFLIGLYSIFVLQVRQYPKMENTTVTVSTSYPGASAQLVQGFITTPIQQSIASAEGIDYLTASSVQGLSTITAYIRLNFDPNAAFTDIMSKVSQVTNQLPTQSQLPVITKSTGETVALMYISFASKSMSPEQVTNYVTRVIQPKLQTVFGVSQISILGGFNFAMRIWFNTKKLAGLNLTTDDVVNAVLKNNFLSAPGSTKGPYVTIPIKATTDLSTAEQFKNIIIYHNKDQLVRLKDVAKVELGSETYDANVSFNNKIAVFVSVTATPTANPLTVITDIRKLLPDLEKNFPPSLKATVVYDVTTFIRASIVEVIRTLIEASVIVIVVIFLFLGSLRTVLIPVVTIPLSLVGVCGSMLALGYSINLLTLLAMVLAIGLVVDDAIVVVENVYRHIEDGAEPFDAAIHGAREIATPIISMTITLAAVYAPIGLMAGLTGALFREFAFTLASAVIISGVVALTLSPMMCSLVLNRSLLKNRYVKWVDKTFERLKNFYERYLAGVLKYRPVAILFAIVVLVSCFFLYVNTSSELAPVEDQGALFVSGTAPDYANIDYTTKYSNEVNKIFETFPEREAYFMASGNNGVNTNFGGLLLKPWDDRTRSQQKIQPILQKDLRKVPGMQISVFPLPSLPTPGSLFPIDFVINSTMPFSDVYDVTQKILKASLASGKFIFLMNSLQFDRPEVVFDLDRSKAASMGITMQAIANALSYAAGGNYIQWYEMEGRSYKVIPQVSRVFRLNPGDFYNLRVKTESGETVPLSDIMTMDYDVQPNSLAQFQQLNAAHIQGVLMPGVTEGEALQFLQTEANKVLPRGMTYDYAGQLRQFVQEGNTLVYTFFFSIIIIYLVLAAQFESFRDPFIVLISVPMSICGALLPLNLGAATINIYTQIGLITLIGLISKHGILIVEFANQLQVEKKLSRHDAVIQAAGIRMRPILMTTAAMVIGVVPLIFAAGAGAESRYDIGIVIATGLLIGTCFTLFIVPTMYSYIATDHNKVGR